MSVWICPSGSPIALDDGNQTFFTIEVSPMVQYGFYFAPSPNNAVLHFYSQDSGGSNPTDVTIGTCSTTALNYLAWVRTPGTGSTFYLGTNGGTLTTASSAHDISFTPSSMNLINQATKGETFTGQITGCKIYPSALTAAEVALDYRRLRPMKTNSGWYPLINNGSLVTDFSGGGNNLAQTGTSASNNLSPGSPWI